MKDTLRRLTACALLTFATVNCEKRVQVEELPEPIRLKLYTLQEHFQHKCILLWKKGELLKQMGECGSEQGGEKSNIDCAEVRKKLAEIESFPQDPFQEMVKERDRILKTADVEMDPDWDDYGEVKAGGWTCDQNGSKDPPFWVDYRLRRIK
jgi:hypothetical protein